VTDAQTDAYDALRMALLTRPLGTAADTDRMPASDGVPAAVRGGFHWRPDAQGMVTASPQASGRQPETSDERHARRVAWGEEWSQTMREAWANARKEG